jgi:hypothetical protein
LPSPDIEVKEKTDAAEDLLKTRPGRINYGTFAAVRGPRRPPSSDPCP